MSDSATVIDMSTEQTWSRIRIEAATAAAREPILASFLNATILNHDRYEGALSYRIAQKLSDGEMNPMLWREVCDAALADEPSIVDAALADAMAYFQRDPACRQYMQPFLYFKGYQALQAQRIGHWLWHHGREELALYLQSRISELFTMDMHPATRIGSGIFIDHASGIVFGETAVIGNNVSILHGVTLGGTGKDGGDRHPKIGNGVLIGAGAKVLGNIIVGNGAKIASGSVVLEPVPDGCTVAGVPAKVVGECPCVENPSELMDQQI